MLIFQKFSTIFFSLTPLSSKWWCSGAINNMRLPLRNNFFVTLKNPTWIITDKDSIIKIPEKIDKVKMLLVNNAIEPKIAPILKDPVSPINIFAG